MYPGVPACPSPPFPSTSTAATSAAENRKLIEDAIQSLDFKVNQAARSLKTNRTMKVGILLPSLDVSFFAGIVADVEARLFENGYNAIICSFDHSPEQEKRKLEFLIDQQVDGVILVAEHPDLPADHRHHRHP